MLERNARQREAAKEARKQAYQKAKERRAKDPRYLELKAAAKARRREHYQQVKQHRKAALAVEKAARSAQRAQVETEERAFYQRRRSVGSSGTVRELLQHHPMLAGELVPLALGSCPLGAEGEVANDVS